MLLKLSSLQLLNRSNKIGPKSNTIIVSNHKGNTMNYFNHIILSSLVLTTACSTQQSIPINSNKMEIEETEKVISRIDSLSERPSWLKESEIYKLKDGNVISLGSTTIPGNHRVDAAIRIAANNAKSILCSAIEQRLDFVFQNAQEGTTTDANLSRFIGAEACKLTASSIFQDKIYWEKVLTKYEGGEKSIRYNVFATVAISESDFKKAILEAINKRNNQGGLSKNFAEKVDKHWDQFVNSGEEKEQEQILAPAPTEKASHDEVSNKNIDNSKKVTKHYRKRK